MTAWTRNDLPGVHWPGIHGESERQGAEKALDAVVEHLNEHHPKPEQDRWRRAHEIVEQERDQAREQWKKWEARAEKSATVIDGLKLALADRASRAEAAEARTAPAVTKAEVEKVVRKALVLYGVDPEGIRDTVWPLVSGSDPAVHVVRESDVAAVKVEQDSHGEWFADGEHIYSNDAEDSRNLATGHLRMAVRRLAVARAIEQEATGPVEDKARELWDVAHPPTPGDVGTWRATWAQATEVERDRYLLLARHVLGQEDRHVDQ